MVYFLPLVAAENNTNYNTSLNIYLPQVRTQVLILQKTGIFYSIFTLRYYDIQKIRWYQKTILRYNYKTNILLSTTLISTK